MVISFYGEGCFKIQIQSGEFTILTDPFDSQTGLTAPRFKPDLIIKTLTAFPIVSPNPPETQYLISGPGEYDIKNVSVFGFGLKKESSEKFLKTVYLIKLEGVRICLLGHISAALEPEIAERLEEIDVLFIPAGGKPFIEQEAAIKIIKQTEPKIVIPMFFRVPGLERKSSDLKIFLEEFDYSQKNGTPQEKLAIRKKDLEAIKKTEIIVLKN